MEIKKTKKEEAERDKIRRSRKSGVVGWWANGRNQWRSRMIYCLCQTKSGKFDSCLCWVLNICAASCATFCLGLFSWITASWLFIIHLLVLKPDSLLLCDCLKQFPKPVWSPAIFCWNDLCVENLLNHQHFACWAWMFNAWAPHRAVRRLLLSIRSEGAWRRGGPFGSYVLVVCWSFAPVIWWHITVTPFTPGIKMWSISGYV